MSLLRAKRTYKSSISTPVTFYPGLHVMPPITAPLRPFSSPTRTSIAYNEDGQLDYDPDLDWHLNPPIHILGLGNLGKLFAHALAPHGHPPPVTILTRRPGLPYAFAKSGGCITIMRDGVATSTPPGTVTISPIKEDDTTPIERLIVTTKAADTAKALKPLLPRLTSDTAIVFTQNGMGVVDEVNSLCFPDPPTRPNYLTAIVTHGVFSTGPFEAMHAAVADVKISITNNGDPARRLVMNLHSRQLFCAIEEAVSLGTTGNINPEWIIVFQLEKLIANACINPLTVIFRTKNAGLLDPRVDALRRVLCQEASPVFKAYLLNKNPGWLLPHMEERVEAERLENTVKGITEKTKENWSSMYQDFDAGRETEVKYINGWIAKVGKEFGFDVRNHEKLVELVEAKEEINMEDIGRVFPKTINI